MELIDVVTKLNGPVSAVGEHHTDQKRKQNLVNLCKLVDQLLFDINQAASDANRRELSMSDIGKYAKKFLADVHSAYEP